MSADCLVCGGSGWIRAAPVRNVKGEGRIRAVWEVAVSVPCFACTTFADYRRRWVL